MTNAGEAWEAFKNIPFPRSCIRVEIDNIDIVSLDTFMAGCIDSFVSSNGKLSLEKRAALEKYTQELEVILPKLDETGRTYFMHLLRLSRNILTYLRKQ